MSNAVIPWREQAPQKFLTQLGGNAEQWEVLTKQFFPAAKSAESVMLVATICKAKGLELMSKPLHIVPMYNAKSGEYDDTIWPGIAYYEITAHRTGEFAGKDPVEFGPMVDHNLAGKIVRAPEWAVSTVYRMVKGTRCAFKSNRIYFAEFCQKLKSDNKWGGKKGHPNDIWGSKPVLMLSKCADAAALRMAFPEVGSEPTAEEMAGGIIDDTYTDAEREQAIVSEPQTQTIIKATTTAESKARARELGVKDVQPQQSKSVVIPTSQSQAAVEQAEDVLIINAESLAGEDTAAPSSQSSEDLSRKLTNEEVGLLGEFGAAHGYTPTQLTVKAKKNLGNLTVGEELDFRDWIVANSRK